MTLSDFIKLCDLHRRASLEIGLYRLQKGDCMAKLLIAEDDEALRQLVCRALESDGHTITECGDPESARELFDADGADILVTDVEMPGGDGVELAKHIAGQKPDIQVVLVSGVVDALARSCEIPARTVVTMAKPFKLETLRAEVAKLVNG